MVGGRMTLLDLLTGPLTAIDRAHAEAALAHPSSHTPEVLAAAAARGVVPGATLPGRPLLLAVSRGVGSVWTLAAEGRPVVGDAARAWRVARRVAARELPLLARPEADEAPVPAAEPLGPGPDDPALDGASFGLAFVLGHWSRLTGVPVAPDLAASATVDEDGRLGRVEGLAEKLAALRAWAPAVRRVVVAADQPTVDPPPGLTLVRLGTADEAWPLAFETAALHAALHAAWADPATADAAARRFFAVALRSPRTHPRWSALAEGSALLAASPEPATRWRARVAHAIASRHAGAPLLLPDGEPPEPLRRPFRVALAAHRVQAANDAAEADWRPLADAARALLPAPGDEHEDDLRLLGALGRLLGAWGETTRARADLRRAVDGWFALDAPGEATYPVSELLRLAGVARDADALAEAEALADRCLVGLGRDASGAAFVALSRGRARCLCGRPDAADALHAPSVDWADAPIHARASRLRWLARLDPEGGHRADLDHLAARAPREAGLAPLWARVEAGEVDDLEGDLGLDPTVAGRLRLELRRIRAVEPGADPRRVAERWPY